MFLNKNQRLAKKLKAAVKNMTSNELKGTTLEEVLDEMSSMNGGYVLLDLRDLDLADEYDSEDNYLELTKEKYEYAMNVVRTSVNTYKPILIIANEVYDALYLNTFALTTELFSSGFCLGFARTDSGKIYRLTFKKDADVYKFYQEY